MINVLCMSFSILLEKFTKSYTEALQIRYTGAHSLYFTWHKPRTTHQLSCLSRPLPKNHKRKKILGRNHKSHIKAPIVTRVPGESASAIIHNSKCQLTQKRSSTYICNPAEQKNPQLYLITGRESDRAITINEILSQQNQPCDTTNRRPHSSSTNDIATVQDAAPALPLYCAQSYGQFEDCHTPNTRVLSLWRSATQHHIAD